MGSSALGLAGPVLGLCLWNKSLTDELGGYAPKGNVTQIIYHDMYGQLSSVTTGSCYIFSRVKDALEVPSCNWKTTV